MANLDSLLTFVDLEKRVREAGNLTQLQFVILNESRVIIEYHSSVLLRVYNNKITKVLGGSGVIKVEEHAPYVVWLKSVITWILNNKNVEGVISTPLDKVPVENQQNVEDPWKQGFGLIVPIKITKNETIIWWLTRSHDWSKEEKATLKLIGNVYGFGWKALKNQNKVMDIILEQIKLWKVLITTAIAVLLLLPVDQSILSPAEVIAEDPLLLTAPMDGVIGKFHVSPNQYVKEGDLLFEMEDTNLKNRYDAARKSYEVAEAEYLKNIYKSFNDPRSHVEVNTYKEKLQEKEVEIKYVEELLKKTKIIAARSGIVLFKDPDDWVGKPVNTGEKIMSLSDPRKIELRVMVPVPDLIDFNINKKSNVFFNINPTKPYHIKIDSVGYEAYLSNAGVLSYPVTAKLESTKDIQIGWQGTAKLYGYRTSLFKYLFRKPLMYLKQNFGI